MLDWIWAGICLITGVCILGRSVYVEHRSMGNGDAATHLLTILLGVILLFFSALAMYEPWLIPLRAWFSSTIPEPGTLFHDLTTFALTLGVVTIYVMAVGAATMLPFERWLKRQTPSQRASSMRCPECGAQRSRG
ncbi:uncharacterized membrane protein YhaH (DUF805 family) [Cupriavidus metallidurans]|jgi:hypothetical protein|uniref:hypothetical protein n=1 Tax=Cupriavidus sp. TaxID=1873897 RepID=UPI000493A9BB|nr:hypothetical protein [Cupriavidus sp.]AVA38103.1 hypothetical protein C3Z06_31370 [Cupriavidus metallidurans]MCA3184279.1 hypothetical protein [Cupriavidus sp.]MCA3188638.1 hypothetical protein [Cupriavidus sp.]MCA3773434.1 hypothetical protein [Cutibacterium sp.]